MELHNRLKSGNMFALYIIAFWVLPVGQLTIIFLAGMVESIGLALFYSDLFVTKLNTYLVKVGWSAGVWWGAGISFAIGLVLASMQAIGTFIFRVIGARAWAITFSVAFWAVSSFSYYAMLSTVQKMDFTMISGVGLMNSISSILIGVCSNNLAGILQKMSWFKDLLESMYKTKRLNVTPKGELVFE